MAIGRSVWPLRQAERAIQTLVESERRKAADETAGPDTMFIA